MLQLLLVWSFDWLPFTFSLLKHLQISPTDKLAIDTWRPGHWRSWRLYLPCKCDLDAMEVWRKTPFCKPSSRFVHQGPAYSPSSGSSIFCLIKVQHILPHQGPVYSPWLLMLDNWSIWLIYRLKHIHFTVHVYCWILFHLEFFLLCNGFHVFLFLILFFYFYFFLLRKHYSIITQSAIIIIITKQ